MGSQQMTVITLPRMEGWLEERKVFPGRPPKESIARKEQMKRISPGLPFEEESLFEQESSRDEGNHATKHHRGLKHNQDAAHVAATHGFVHIKRNGFMFNFLLGMPGPELGQFLGHWLEVAVRIGGKRWAKMAVKCSHATVIARIVRGERIFFPHFDILTEECVVGIGINPLLSQEVIH